MALPADGLPSPAQVLSALSMPASAQLGGRAAGRRRGVLARAERRRRGGARRRARLRPAPRSSSSPTMSTSSTSALPTTSTSSSPSARSRPASTSSARSRSRSTRRRQAPRRGGARDGRDARGAVRLPLLPDCARGPGAGARRHDRFAAPDPRRLPAGLAALPGRRQLARRRGGSAERRAPSPTSARTGATSSSSSPAIGSPGSVAQTMTVAPGAAFRRRIALRSRVTATAATAA